jgi:microcin C transport system permease protein
MSTETMNGLASSLSPGQRVWQRFRSDRRGYFSLIIFSVLFILSLFSELISNDRPLIARYDGQILFPIAKDYS